MISNLSGSTNLHQVLVSDNNLQFNINSATQVCLTDFNMIIELIFLQSSEINGGIDEITYIIEIEKWNPYVTIYKQTKILFSADHSYSQETLLPKERLCINLRIRETLDEICDKLISMGIKEKQITIE